MAIDGLTILVASMLGLACLLLGWRRPVVVFPALTPLLPFGLPASTQASARTAWLPSVPVLRVEVRRMEEAWGAATTGSPA